MVKPRKTIYNRPPGRIPEKVVLMNGYDELTEAIRNLEAAAKKLPVKASKEALAVVEELVYMRLRVSLGESK